MVDVLRDLKNSLGIYADRRVLVVMVLGFASGLPAPLVYSNLSIWLLDLGVSRTEIGLFAFVATPYAINFLWAPLLDRVRMPFLHARLGRRRAWALVLQVLLMAALVVMGLVDPARQLHLLAAACLFVTTVSATLDVVIDAYRIDVLEPERYGAGSAAAIWGWHLGGTLIGGAGGLYLADHGGWNFAYQVLALSLLVTIAATLLAPEPKAGLSDGRPGGQTGGQTGAAQGRRPGGSLAEVAGFLHEAVIAPFLDFMTRRGWLLILIFVFVFKLGDALLGRMSGVFYRELGFDLREIADIAKVYGLTANAIGVLIGGFVVYRLGTLKALFVGGFAAAVTNLAYAGLALAGQDLGVFTLAVIADSFTGGLGTVAFVAYLSSLCTVAYSATQYALLASLGNLARIWFAASAGWMVDTLDGDWALFFTMTAGVALIGLPLLVVLMIMFPEPKRNQPPPADTPATG